ncbi:MAG: hypothetical protein GVY16_00450 [Planctomycetes bacterium]|jgi:type IV pilus assembly protein PilQ|nr:hypothetical protein [Planctomycetota bacterium]
MLYIRCTALTWVLAIVVATAALSTAAWAQQEPTGVETDDTTTTTTTVSGEDTGGARVVRPGPGGQISIKTPVGGADVRQTLVVLSIQGQRQGKKQIVPSNNVTGSINLQLDGLTWEQALKAVLKSSNLVAIEEEDFIYVYTAQEADAFVPIKSRVFRLAYLTAADAKVLVEKSLSEKGSITVTPAPSSGIAASTEETGGKSHAAGEVLIVYDYEENLDAIEELLEELDVRPKQVLIESTILSAQLTEDNALGLNIQAITGAEFGQMVDADGVATTTDLTSGLTAPATDINNLNRRNMRVSMPMSVNQQLEGSPLTIGLVWNDISVFLRALESITDTTVLANPKLLVVNNQRGEVLIGRKEGYLTTTITSTAAAQEVEYLETGTRLIVRPYVGDDGWVRMEVHPEVSEGGVEQVGETGTALPRAATTEATTNVMIRDGKTLVIGGLFRERDVANRAQVPVLGSIPVLGIPFRSTVDTKLREEVIILITPHIMQAPVDEIVSDQLRNDMERTRIGGRRGMMWLNRAQFANWHLHQAKRDLVAGKESAAMWNLDLALAYEPKMIQAIRLKERLTDQAYWAEQPRFVSSRDVVKRMIMQDLGMPIESVQYPTRPLSDDRIPLEARERMSIENPIETPVRGPRRMSAPPVRGDEAGIEILPPPEPNESAEPPMIKEEPSSETTVIIEDEPVAAPTPPGHSPETAPELTPAEPDSEAAEMDAGETDSDEDKDTTDEAGSKAPAATPTIDRLLQLDDEPQARSTSPAPKVDEAAEAEPATDVKSHQAAPAPQPEEPATTQPRKAPAAPSTDVTHRSRRRGRQAAQTVRPLRVWVPKSGKPAAEKELAERDVPSLWDAMAEQEAK